jgi:glyoxylate/hydroxypyruvate reductase
MALLIVAPNRDISIWKKIIQENDPELEYYVWPDCERKSEVVAAVAWNHPIGCFQDYPNIELISSMGAGVDHIMKDTTIDPEIKITRIVDSVLTISMTNYVLMAVLNYHKQFFKYQKDKDSKVWHQQVNPEIDLSIGIMGMGVLGQDVALKLNDLGFKVFGYSNTKKIVSRVKSFAGQSEIQAFLNEINMLICMLPLTSSTRGILNLSFFRKMQKGSIIINVARGALLIEEDLLIAIEEGYISSAFLDVFQTEPLPKDHAFWKHPDIFITPHIASVTNPYAAVPQILNNYKRLLNKEPLQNLIDRNKEY